MNAQIPLFFILSVFAAANFTETFDGGWNDPSFANISTFNSPGIGLWESRDALVSNDRARSGECVRLNRNANAYLEYQGLDGNGADGGVDTVSFWVRHWDGDGSTIVFALEYNINNAGWVQAATGSTSGTSYQKFSHTLNLTADNIRLRIVPTSDPERLLIDDVEITSSGIVNPPPTGPTLVVVSANTTSGIFQQYEGPGDRIFQAIAPDVVGLQEFNVPDAGGRRAWVDRVFGTQFDFYVEPGNEQLPTGIISRYPIIAAGQWADSQVSNRDISWATIDIPGQINLHVVSAHFVTSSSGVRNNEAGILINNVTTQFPPGDYIVLCGDLNASARNEAAITTLKSVFSDARIPVDQNGNFDTNANRNDPYDWVMPNATMETRHISTTIAGINFPNGHVFDTRVWGGGVPGPALASDSGASGMQHMAVIKTFRPVVDQIPPIITLTGGTVILAAGQAYVEPGFSASDNIDGNITANVLVANTIPTPSLPGSYVVTYQVSDSAGNPAQTNRVVNVTDQTPPVITLMGGQVNLAAGAAYAEPGFTATDDVDGNLTAAVVVNSTIPSPSVPGTFTVTYDVVDTAGNAAPQVTRTVVVTDQTRPVITITGGTVNLAAGTPYTEPGFLATDNIDGNLTSSVVVNSTVPTPTVPGTYTIRYSVSDSAGNQAIQPLRTVIVTDSVHPVITLVASNLTLAAGTPYTEPGFTASDDVDGNITANVTVISTVNPAVPGSYTVTYQVADSSGNPTSIIRNVLVTDQSPPVITLIGGSVVLAAGNAYSEPGFSAMDNIDGDLTASVAVTNNLPNPTVPGSYMVGYTVRDAAGNKAMTSRVVTVGDQTPPVINLAGDNPLNLAAGQAFIDPGFTAIDNVDGNLASSVTIISTLPTPTLPGTYTVTYSVSDAAANTGTVVRTIMVGDQTRPVINLTGGPVDLAAGQPYVELGFTAFDNVDGDLTSNVLVNDNIPAPSIPGVYTVTYQVSDLAGNAAQTNRAVTVTDQTPPLITLTGGTVNLVAGIFYVEPGFSAIDNVDGNLTPSVAVSSNVPSPTEPGTFTVMYSVNDAAGNNAQTSRTVVVTDQTPPTITLTEGTVDLAAGDDFIEPGFSAADAVDGDLTSAVTVNPTLTSPATPGVFTIVYTVEDAAGNSASTSRTVIVTDQTSPVITLTGGPLVIPAGSNYVEPGFSAFDNIDGNLTPNVLVTSTVPSPVVPGIYAISYTVMDAAGNNATTSRSVTVTDQRAPSITLVGGPANLLLGEPFLEPGFSASDDVDGDLTLAVSVADNLPQLPTTGSFIVTYRVSDAAGNNAQTTRVVQVADGDPDGDGMPSSWEIEKGLDPLVASGADGADRDNDGDGFSNWEEYISDTDPNDEAMLLRLTDIEVEGVRMICFPGVPSRNYTLEFAPVLDESTGFWAPLASHTNVPGAPDAEGLIMVPDPNTENKTRFYRVRVQLP